MMSSVVEEIECIVGLLLDLHKKQHLMLMKPTQLSKIAIRILDILSFTELFLSFTELQGFWLILESF